MRSWFADDRDVVERIARRFLSFLRDDKGLNALERSDLPIDMEHLRLEEGRAITGDYRFRRGSRPAVAGSRDVSQVRLRRHLKHRATERSIHHKVKTEKRKT